LLSDSGYQNINRQARKFNKQEEVNLLAGANELMLQEEKKRKIGLNNNQLKIIAMLTMLIDHIGVSLLPSVITLRVIGRISFPIFAYMIAEGCHYTKNRPKYFISIFSLGFVCQLVYFIAERSMYQNILLGFSFAILAIFSLDLIISRRNALFITIGTVGFLASSFVTLVLPILLKEQGFMFDYGEYAFVLPIFVYYMPNKWRKTGGMAIILAYRAYISGWIHWFTLIPVALLMLYNGERGRLKLKYMFYIFYPAHLLIIYLIGMLI